MYVRFACNRIRTSLGYKRDVVVNFGARENRAEAGEVCLGASGEWWMMGRGCVWVRSQAC